jgi:hypothetical protein
MGLSACVTTCRPQDRPMLCGLAAHCKHGLVAHCEQATGQACVCVRRHTDFKLQQGVWSWLSYHKHGSKSTQLWLTFACKVWCLAASHRIGHNRADQLAGHHFQHVRVRALTWRWSGVPYLHMTVLLSVMFGWHVHCGVCRHVCEHYAQHASAQHVIQTTLATGSAAGS